MRLLVTGALGHIGSKLIREYAKRQDIELIRIFDNISTQRYCSLFNLPQKRGLRYEFIEAGIDDKKALKRAMQKIDVVIHLAAITDAPSTIATPKLTHKVNFEGTKNVLMAAIDANVKKFLFPSTTSVYGEAEGLVDENSPENMYKPASPYAATKLKAEKFILKTAKAKGFNANVLRMGTIFGTCIGMRFHTAINKFCWLAVMNKPLTVWDSALNSMRPYLGLNDCIRAFYFLEKHGKPGELYNVVTRNYSMKNIIETIKQFVPNVQIQITKSPLLNQKPYEVGNEKIKKIGFEFKDTLSGGIRATLVLMKGVRRF